jgi:hypothetical protein
MPQYLVLKTSANGVPPDGQTGSADIYLGTHADALTARRAAASKWNLGPNVNLWSVDSSTLATGITSVTAT